ncbi:unnamed protein product [Ostreobium quekettii]|uniref:TAP42-like protein n=1 Tax=Ostreobium quekettii TaxID=121088 RepID=A0A8S1IRQ3_9CHLO|nr:unnamed protein product [Ostreobium quekettii]|eukprot:evm.model.scf_494EXC.5 EVM.evm.TU.scf_494EXC.5   scf_494EXC:58049-62350(-)
MGLPPEVLALDLSPSLGDVPLSELFERARTIHAHLASIPASGDRGRSLLCAALAWLAEAEARLALLGVFSPNEDADDLATGDLKYVLVPFYMAELMAAARGGGDPAEDGRALVRALRCLAAFLERCRQYGLFGEVIPDAEDSHSPLDANARRTQKVARFKRAREVEKQLEKLQRLRSNMDRLEKDAEDPSHVLNIDEEVTRRTWLLTIEWAAAQALDQQQVLRQEVEILKVMEERGESRQGGNSGASGTSAQEAPSQSHVSAEMMQKLAAIGASLAGQGRQRQAQAQAEVFRPSHILPTVTVEQQAVKEWREALALQQAREAAASKRAGDESGGSGSEEEGGKGVYEQRAWDDWKDDHPRGYGNSKLRPCAQ